MVLDDMDRTTGLLVAGGLIAFALSRGNGSGGGSGGGGGGAQPSGLTASFDVRRDHRSSKWILDGSESVDPDGEIVQWAWDLGNDGDIDHIFEQSMVRVDPFEPKQLRLMVTASDGEVTETARSFSLPGSGGV